MNLCLLGNIHYNDVKMKTQIYDKTDDNVFLKSKMIAVYSTWIKTQLTASTDSYDIHVHWMLQHYEIETYVI